MPTLRPLEQFFCDSCGAVIARPAHGIVTWAHEEDADVGRKNHSFTIIHAADRTPNPSRPCDDGVRTSVRPLVDWLGTRGLIHGFGMLDAGLHHQPRFSGTRVRDVREWTELMRRLHLPYFEEARHFWTPASAGYFGDVSEEKIYQPTYLRQLIEHFEREHV
ncbi:MAG: hypothetical protein ACHREM_09790 [Polyangiales bacterium]